MKNLISFQKPYVSPIDLKVTFNPRITLSGSTLNVDELLDLKVHIDKTVNDIRFINDYFEKYKDDESMLARLVSR